MPGLDSGYSEKGIDKSRNLGSAEGRVRTPRLISSLR